MPQFDCDAISVYRFQLTKQLHICFGILSGSPARQKQVLKKATNGLENVRSHSLVWNSYYKVIWGLSFGGISGLRIYGARLRISW